MGRVLISSALTSCTALYHLKIGTRGRHHRAIHSRAKDTTNCQCKLGATETKVVEGSTEDKCTLSCSKLTLTVRCVPCSSIDGSVMPSPHTNFEVVEGSTESKNTLEMKAPDMHISLT